MIYMFLAQGFEEIEAIATLDVLRRADLEVFTVGIGDKTIVGAHNIPVVCDLMDNEVIPDENVSGIVLPGGMPGTLNLEKSVTVQSFLDYAASNNLLIAAICAAPSILGHKGLLKGKKAVCFDGFEDQLLFANVMQSPVCIDGNILTANGAGAAIQFGLGIVSYFKGETEAKRLGAAMKCII